MILDGCRVRFERGERGPTAFGKPKIVEFKPTLPLRYIKKRDQMQLVNALLRYYRKAGGDEKVMPVLEAFLWCAVPFLFKACPPKERTIGNCIRLAEAAQLPRRGGISPFEIVMQDAKRTDTYAFKELKRREDYWTSRQLVSAFKTIQDYLFKFRYPCEFQFKLTGSKN